jgi:hypothetical protein
MPQTTVTENRDSTPTTQAGNTSDGANVAALATPNTIDNTQTGDSVQSAAGSSVVKLPEAQPQVLKQIGPIEIMGQSQSVPLLKTLLEPFLASDGRVYVKQPDTANVCVALITGPLGKKIIQTEAMRNGQLLRRQQVDDVVNLLQVHADTDGDPKVVSYRVAKYGNGVEVDLGNKDGTRVRISEGKVEIIESGSPTRFYRTSSMKAMAYPTKVGNLKKLRKYLNVDDASYMLVIGWLSYTLLHPKEASAKYLILVINGFAGTGKTFLSTILMMLLDPRSVGVQPLPTNGKDFAVAIQSAFLNVFDNTRAVPDWLSDLLCICSSGGVTTARALFTDSDQLFIVLHGPAIISSIGVPLSQADAIQRCLQVNSLQITDANRKSELALMQEFLIDLPEIQRGLFDLMAGVLLNLPRAQVTNPERMYDFCLHLAAMELFDGVPAGIYQGVYSMHMREGQREGLLDNVLAASVLEFSQSLKERWFGTPTELLKALNAFVPHGVTRSRQWPDNAISLSKRLTLLQAGLVTQGVQIEFVRGKHRAISITNMEVGNE